MAFASCDIWAASNQFAEYTHAQPLGGQGSVSGWGRIRQEQLLCRQADSRRRQLRQAAASAHAQLGGAGALGPPINGQLLRVVAASGIGGAGREEVGPQPLRGVSSAPQGGDPLFLTFPERSEGELQQTQEPPLVRVRLTVHYRVHSRQMLCIGGSKIPFGWSFLSIAKVPMQWSEGDIWITEVELPAGSEVEYKYVVMEEQDWTSQVSEDAEGIVSFSYRTKPDDPPDVQTISKQMAIVAWQPGPNRMVKVPDLKEVSSLVEGEVREREPARTQQQAPAPQAQAQQAQAQQARSSGGRQYGEQAFGQGLLGQQQPSASGGSSKDAEKPYDPMAGTWEKLSLVDGEPLVERRDVWGLPDPVPRRNPLEGLRFDS